jgi:hypothetical protein
MSDFEYANAPESRAVANIASNYGLFIGGKFVMRINLILMQL